MSPPDLPPAVVRINAFGALEAAVGGSPVFLGPPKQRTLLAVLLCRPTVALSTEDLVDVLWPDRPPASAANNLRSYVHGLRRVLGRDVIVGGGPRGYRVGADRLSTDIGRFDALCTAADAALAREDTAAARENLVEAVALRRDRAFADVGPVEVVTHEADRLEERWLLAVEQRIEADLTLGRAAELVGELTALVAAHPYRERFVHLLMLALYRSGRQAEALTVYRRAAATFADELGVEPGAELTELHRALLRQDPGLDRPIVRVPTATAPVPAELPPGSGRFTGRARENAAMSEVIADFHDRRALPLVAVVGPAGVGKTAFVVQWAQHVTRRYSDGQIFLDLRGFSAEPPLGPADALRRVLRSLGVAASRIPVDVEEAAALYRSLLFDKRMLIVLDNVSSARQIIPLLPGGHGNTVVLTGRNRFPDLTVGYGSHHLMLGPLPGDEARDLIDGIVGAGRVAAEPDAAERLAARCDHLPLALCIAAADLAEDPTRTITAYLADHWVDTLDPPGDSQPGVRIAVDLSLRALTGRQQDLLGLLALVPGPDITVDAVVALTAGSRTTAGEDLARLADAHLIQRTPNGRFTFHDLIREYARDRSGAVPAADRTAALTRLFTYYQDNSDAADRVLQPGALRLPGADAAPTGMNDRAAGMWFADEMANLVAACRYAVENGPRRPAARIADAVGRYLWTRYDFGTWSTVAQVAARAAEADGDVEATVTAELALGQIADCRGDLSDAEAHFAAAVTLARQADWHAAEAVALGSMAAVQGERGDPLAAVRQQHAVVLISRHLGDRLQEGKTLIQLGNCLHELGRLAERQEVLDEALTLIDSEGSRIGRAIILDNLAENCALRGDFDRADAYAREALSISDELGHMSAKIVAHVAISMASRGRGDPADALSHALEALATAARLGSSRSLGVAQHETAASFDALGEPRHGLVYHRSAHRLAQSSQSRYSTVEYAIALALAEHRCTRLGPLPEGEPPPDLSEALRHTRDHGFRGLEGAALGALAEVSENPDEARRYATQALAIQREAGWYSDNTLLSALAHPS